MRQKIEEYLKARFPDREELSIGEVETISGGFSYQHFLFNVYWRGSQGPVSEGMVIRREPDMGLVPPYDIRPQYEVFKSLQGTGVPVPEVYWLEEDSNVLGRRFFLMKKIEGGERLFTAWHKYPADRGKFVQDCASALAKIHGLDWQALGLSFLGAAEDYRRSAEKRVARWEKVVEESQYYPYPALTEQFAWLRRNIPRAERISLCHGDYQVNNCFVRNGQIVGVFDWEMADIGDPICDLAYICLNHTLLIPDWDETAFIRSYEKMTGAKVNEESLFYWKVFTAVKLSGIQIAAIKAGCESEVIHLQLLALFGIGVPAVVDVGARLLKF